MRDDLPAGLRPGGRFDAWAPQQPAYAVADVDGTLVGPEPTATARVADAVRAAEEVGLRVGYATGRMRLAVEALHGQLAASGPHVLHNGAEVRAGGATVAAWPLTRQQLATVLAIARRLDVYAEVYVEHGYLVTARDERARPHWDLLGHDPLGVVARPEDAPGKVLKATFGCFPGDPVADVVSALEQAGLSAGPAGSPRTPGIGYVNATHPEADKGRALRHAAAHLGVPMAAVVAVGDAPNDLSMLEVAGTAIAMGQAPPEVVAASHLIVPEVDADGVAHALDAARRWRADAGSTAAVEG